MANAINRQHHLNYLTPRSSLQKVCIVFGFFLIALSLVGSFVPGFMALHLSRANNIINLAGGILGLWCGYSNTSTRSYNFTIAFGTVFAIVGVAGFVLGEPGYPSVGFTQSDGYLMRVIPYALEFGTRDHILHLAFSVLLLSSAYLWKTDPKNKVGKVTADNQARAGLFDVNERKEDETSPSVRLSPKDLDHLAKKKNLTDFEKHV